MRRLPLVLALSAVACTPRAASPAGASQSHAATVVEVPPPSAASAAPQAPTAAADAGLAPQSVDASLPGASAMADGGVSLSLSAAVHFGSADGGFVFHGSLSGDSGVSLTRLSPRFVVRSALLVRGPYPHGRELSLYDNATHCSKPTGRHLDVAIGWKRGTQTTFVKLRLANSQLEHYKGHIEVLSAPTRPGAIGKIRVTRPRGGNVLGGVVRVHVCR